MIRRPRPCRVVFDGQSRLAIPSWYGFLGYSWGRLVMAGRGLPAYPVAISGWSWSMLIDNFATRAAPWISAVEPTIYVMCGGGSDILTEGNSGAQTYADAGAIAQLARDAGAVYVLCTTILPGTLFTDDPSGTAEQRRLDTNAAILADAAGHFDDTVNLDVPGLLDTSDRDVYFDGTHVYGPGEFDTGGGVIGRGLGTGRVADVVRPHIDAAIAAVTAD